MNLTFNTPSLTRKAVLPCVQLSTYSQLGIRNSKHPHWQLLIKKLADLWQGRARELKPEVDEITPCQVVEGLDADDVEPLREQSALHKD